MKRETRSVYCRLSWLSLVIVLLLTAACSAATINTATSSATTASQSTGVLPAPTQPPAQPASTQPAPTEPPATPTNSAPALPPAPVCDASVKVTPSQTEGPYYKPDTPERASLVEPGMSGTKLIVTGVVLTTDCKPIAGAWLDFWQANDEGVYDNAGYTLRGHQATDENGRYTLDTILPGLYPGRTRHIHVKVQAPNHPVLTTQLYFPDEPSNNSDSIFDPALIVNLQDTAGGKVATFNFVLDVK